MSNVIAATRAQQARRNRAADLEEASALECAANQLAAIIPALCVQLKGLDELGDVDTLKDIIGAWRKRASDLEQ